MMLGEKVEKENTRVTREYVLEKRREGGGEIEGREEIEGTKEILEGT